MELTIDRLKKARAKMLIKHPFFATLMMSMPMIETHEVPTAATDMKSLYVNPDFIASVDDDILMFVLGHEIMHTALEHGLRRGVRHPMLWNIAADYAINLILKDSKFKVWENALLDEKYRDMSADKIYDQLKKEIEEQQQQGGGGDPKDGAGEPGGEHHSPMLGDLKEPDVAGDAAAEDRLRKDIQQRVAQAAAIAHMTGNMSGSLERFVNEVLNPKVEWFELLRHLMTEAAEDDEDWSHRNRRFQMYLPSNYSEKMGEMVAIGDSSGSCYDDIPAYFAEFLAIAEDLQPERIRLVWADTCVKGEQVFERGDEITMHPRGFGGTDMRVPLRHVEDYDPKIVVLFTDGCSPFPSEPPPYPLIMCVTTNTAMPDWAEVIRL